MLRLYTLWELERELLPDEFQHILTPDAALKKATYCYDLDYRNYVYPPCCGVPCRRNGVTKLPYKCTVRSVYDPVYDDLEINLMEGWVVGLDTDDHWDESVNPFYINDDGDLIFGGSDSFCWIISDFKRAYQFAINNRNGNRPEPTVKFQLSGEPIQHAQVAKIINNKAAGWLLAAGGIYNGNIEGFHQTAELLGGDAPAGYDQMMNGQTKGLFIAGASIAAGLGIGRLNAVNAIDEISNYSKIPALESPYLKGFTSEAGTLLNAEHAVIDPKKLASYSLNPAHPVGGNKARVFESALGYNSSNADILASKIQQGLMTNPAELGVIDNFGQRMSVDMPIIGINGETVTVRTGWMYEAESLVPRMTTLYVK